MKDIRQRLLATFPIEHHDHVEQIRSLLAMIANTGGAAGPDLDEAFRRAHSLKGAARAVDLAPVESLAHSLETLLFRVKQGALPLNPEVTGVVHRTLDASEDCMAALGSNQPVPDVAPALEAIRRMLGTEPPVPPVLPNRMAPEMTAFQPVETVRVNAGNFDGMLRSAAALVSDSLRQEPVTAQLAALALDLTALEYDAWKARRGGVQASALLESVGRQAHLLSQRAGAAHRLQQRHSWATQRLAEQLQQDVWRARMVPAESLLEGYRQMMRSLARDEGKQIDFQASSSGVQADRSVLGVLKDPLMHVLRNAVSHGIEDPRERSAKGKPPSGLVELRIASEGRRLTIAIEDDGRGFDTEQIAAAAVRLGIVAPREASRRSLPELVRVVFQPGFTTSDAVTDLAGRGMGLSVVYEAVRRLQGDVDFRPRPGGGAAVHISVPLSISTNRLLVVSCAGQPFAIPIHWIERLTRVRPDRIETLEGRPVLPLDGQLVPIRSLRLLLGREAPGPPNSRGEMLVMILRARNTRTAVVVDDVLRETEAVIQDLGPLESCNRKVSGAVVLDGGDVAIVLNPMELLDAHALSGDPRHPWAPWAPPVPQTPRSILVVDDSMTTRTLEKNILEARGYRVIVAVDGVEALEAMRSAKPDLVVADMQMPRMDGFQLLEAIKKDPALRDIPVIVVTSLDRREDRERGLALGADAYVVKQKFDQEELLATIRQIL